MKSRCFVLAAILAMIAMTIILINQVTQAQSPDRGDQRVGLGASLVSFADKSWVDLTFTLKVDDDTLIKARPVYQKYRDNLGNTVKDREPGASANLYRLMKEIRDEFMAELQVVLTEAQIAKLKTLEKKRVRMMLQDDGK